MSVFPFGGPVVELGGSTPCRPSVLLAGAYCGAVRPGLRISAVSPAGLGFELDPSQTRTEAENQIPAVPSRTGGRPPPPPHTTALLSWRRAYLSPRWFRGSAT